MASQTLMWTVCPNGISNGKLRLAAVVSPRLEGDSAHPTLQSFPDMLNWPEKAVTFKVMLEYSKLGAGTRGAVTRETLEATAIGPTADPSMWRAIFGDGSGVRVDSYTFTDVSSHPFRTFSVAAMRNLVLQSHLNLIAASPQSPPSVKQVLASDAFGPLATVLPVADALLGKPVVLTAEQKQLIKQLPPFVRAWRVPTRKGSTVVPAQITGLRFSMRPSRGIELQAQRAFVLEGLQYRRRRPGPHLSAPPPPKPDFHNVVASLGQYSEVASRVGLTFQLEAPLPASLPRLGLGRVRIWVVPTWHATAPQAVNVTPKTVARLTASSFEAVPRDPASSGLAGGWLTLGDTSAFTIVELDVDGASMSQAAYMSTLQVDPSGNPFPPPLRSAGIGVARANRSIGLLTGAQNSAGNNAALNTNKSDPTRGILLYAEDLTRGYRIDVYHQPAGQQFGQWYSLFQRLGTYSFLTMGQKQQFADEGWVGFAATQDAGTNDLNVHEMLFRWMGWSLAAPRPGGAMADDGTVPAAADGTPQDSTRTTPPAASPYQVQVSFKPKPGSLPRLRYGDTYRLRARVVDLAGNSLPPDASSAGVKNSETAAIMYGRFDPIVSPVVIPRTTLGPGETPTRLVMRSAYDTTTDTYATPTSVERHLLPPHAAPSVAELHGRFDAVNGSGKSIVDVGAYGTILSHEGVPPDGEPGATLVAPYLPEPLARGATFYGLPQSPRTFQPVLYSGTWPSISSARLILGPTSKRQAGPALRTVTLPNSPPLSLLPPVTTGALTVLLRPGEQVTMFVSSTLDLTSLPLLAIWNQLSPRLISNADFDLARQLVAAGAFWAVTPYSPVTLTYAVQVPLVPGGRKQLHYKSLQATRYVPGETVVRLVGSLAIDGPSTGTFQVVADWTDPLDDPTTQAPGTVAHSTNALLKHVLPNQMELLLKGRTGDLHEVGDTKAHTITYSGVATTRYADCFDPETSPLTRPCTAITASVPSSARPAPPAVRYAIPSVGWSARPRAGSENGRPITSRRTGGSLRIYLDRPWYSSGEGELLGVVYYPPQPPAGQASGTHALGGQRIVPPDQLRPYVTQWGVDPVHGGVPTFAPSQQPDEYIASNISKPSNWPVAVAFTSQSVVIAQNGTCFDGTAEVPAGASLAGLKLDEMTGRTDSAGSLNVSVAPYAVTFDADRRLWYADIQLNIGLAHMPIVRLALVRYQPNSIAGVELSRVMLADIIQLLPDRTATLTVSGASATVSVTGHSYATLDTYRREESTLPLHTGTLLTDYYRFQWPRFTATLEEAAHVSSDLQAWRAVSEPLVMQFDQGTQYAESFVVRAAFNNLERGTQYRIVVREYEGAMTDANRSDRQDVSSRLVYADALDLPRL